MKKPLVSIGIASYNGHDHLRKLLSSIFQNLPMSNFEVIVVDDGSGDKTAGMVQSEFPKAKLIINEKNEGLAESTNKAVRSSQGKYFLRLDADTQILPDSIEPMISFMEENPQIGVLGPKLIYPDGCLQHSTRKSWPTPLFVFNEFSFVVSKILGLLWEKLLPAKTDDMPQRTTHVLGAAMLIRKKAIQEVGFMDHHIANFRDETDWQYRMAKAGWEIWYYPQATIMHVGGQSAEDLYIFANPRNLKSLWRFNRKHFPGKWNQIRFFIAILSGALISLTIGIFMYLPSRFHPHAKTTVDKIIRSFGRVIVWHLLAIGIRAKLALNTKQNKPKLPRN